ncbi:helix-turn-helix transcriptional regulator [Immundisolibacter sp.]|uniref:helix-turn-helix transcriptional regulator n=1 Tax=Immundisolibacter sp. TaxID=1934948 RepID=UPI003561C422
MKYDDLPNTALLRLSEIIRPEGPVPLRRTKWLDMVKAGEAPAPVVSRHRFTAWRWDDVKAFLEQLASGGVV